MDKARCSQGPREVTVTFDAEDSIDTFRALVAVICPGNLAVVGHALISAVDPG